MTPKWYGSADPAAISRDCSTSDRIEQSPFPAGGVETGPVRSEGGSRPGWARSADGVRFAAEPGPGTAILVPGSRFLLRATRH